MGRFAQFRPKSDYKPLRKLAEAGDGFTERLSGSHTFTTEDGDELPVLDFPEFSWLASTWHALEELADADPQDGEIVRVRRLPDRGRSHQYEVRVLDERGGELPARIGGDIPTDLPPAPMSPAGAGSVPADDDAPFCPSVA